MLLRGYRGALGMAILAGLWGLVGSNPARAGISYEIIFRSTGSDQVSFASVAEARAATVVSDLIMTTTDALIFNSISVGWDDSFGLDVATARKWAGLSIPGGVYESTLGGPVECGDNPVGTPSPPTYPHCIFFLGRALPNPVAPPSLPPGTYNMGTIIWDTTAIGAGQSSLFPFVYPGLDATGVVRPPRSGQRNIIDVTGIEELFAGAITVIPEPASATLVGTGVFGLVLLARRSRRG